MLISHLADQIGARLTGGDVDFTSVSTDTRQIKPGDLFVALKGLNFDAHEFVDLAFRSGAAAAMVDCNFEQSFEHPMVRVKDTRLGLGQLGKTWLAQFDVSKIAITGSCGKTSVKEMVAAILANEGDTLATQGNLNNDIGVPLTLCRIKQHHRFAVIEMGANHVGEIAYVAALVEPHVALVNNVGPAHLEGFGSIDNVAQAKSEIYENLANNGIAVINLDDDYADYFLNKTRNKVQMTFSAKDQSADVWLRSSSSNPLGQYQFEVHCKGDDLSIQLSLIGAHNVNNALAAITIAKATNCSAQAIVKGLESLHSVPGRLNPLQLTSQLRVIDDSYNANPASIRSAIDLLSSLPGTTCLVLGDMAELGDDEVQQHREIGQYAAEKGIQNLYVTGRFAQHYLQGFQQAASATGDAVELDSHEQVASALLAMAGDRTVLVKGSRSAAMEKVIDCIKRQLQIEGSH